MDVARYAALFSYIADQGHIQAVRPEHRDYLRRLRDEGSLRDAGRFGDERGGLLVYTTDTEAEARALFDADPFTRGGVISLDSMQEWLVVVSAVEEVG